MAVNGWGGACKVTAYGSNNPFTGGHLDHWRIQIFTSQFTTVAKPHLSNNELILWSWVTTTGEYILEGLSTKKVESRCYNGTRSMDKQIPFETKVSTMLQTMLEAWHLTPASMLVDTTI